MADVTTGRDAAAAAYAELAAQDNGDPIEPIEAPPEPIEEPAPLEGDPTATPPAGDPSSTEPPAEGRTRDDKGRFAPKAQAPATTTKTTPPPAGTPPSKTAAPAPAQTTQTQPPAPGITTKANQPPQSLSAEAKMDWAKMPESVQQWIARREAQQRDFVNQTAEHRRVSEQFQRAVMPYMQDIQAAGSNPYQSIQNAFEGMRRLGDPSQGPQMAAEILWNYRLDPAKVADAFEALARQGGPQAQRAPVANYQNLDPNLIAQQVESRLLQRQESQATQRVLSEWLPKQEFLDEVDDVTGIRVRDHLAAMVDQYRQAKGVNPDGGLLDQMVARANMMVPKVAAVIRQREEAARAEQDAAKARKAQIASSGIRGSTTGVTPPTEPAAPEKSARETAARAYQVLQQKMAG